MRSIPGYENLYSINEAGEIFSVKNGRRRPLKPWTNDNGYCRVILQHPDKGKKVYYRSINEAIRDGFSSGVGGCCRGERKTHKGYRWEYAI